MPNWLRRVIFIVFLGVFLYSSFTLISYWYNSRKQAGIYEGLAQIVEQAKTDPAPTQYPSLPGIDPNMVRPILPEYQQLHDRNPDMVGWISIPGTVINYPVMQTPEEPDYYLYTNFNNEYSVQGSIFAQENCDVFAPSTNITLYGHRMIDGSMFGVLPDYLNTKFYAEHPYIQFDSLYDHRTYEVFCIFVTSANEGEGFVYAEFVEAGIEEEFESYVNQCIALAKNEVTIIPTYGDHLLTLSTCINTVDNGRFVVVARQVAPAGNS